MLKRIGPFVSMPNNFRRWSARTAADCDRSDNPVRAFDVIVDTLGLGFSSGSTHQRLVKQEVLRAAKVRVVPQQGEVTVETKTDLAIAKHQRQCLCAVT
jgi:hypothetical protein